jgi:hypothetical protein
MLLAWGGDRPRILSIRLDRSEVVVEAEVPTGIRKVTLESHTRLGPAGWEPRAVARVDGQGGRLEFRLPKSTALEVLRIRGDATEPLPAAFYRGTNAYGVQPSGASGAFPYLGGPEDGRNTTSPDASGSRDVVESDIWKLQGDSLFFFNQYRGLQVIDVAAPDQARVTGTLSLPAAGEQMYVLPEGEVVLLARDGCGAWGSGSESQILIVTITEGVPEIAARVPVAGYVVESRLVGTALYVASQTYRPVADSDNTRWEWGTALSSIDLARPTEPVRKDTLWFAGYGHAVTATDRYCFLAVQSPSDWRRSLVHTIDISSPDGAMKPLNTLLAAGSVADKFKMQVYGDVFTVISQVQSNTLFTELETFSFQDPVAPRKLGQLSLGLSERLHATRFAGDRVYVVTFFVRFQMDPLWVVDLSKPEAPTVVGALEIPGWSTYLHPWGDNRLVAAGIETNQTTVSLFDVGDPAHPALLKRVTLGTGWSWSEINNDEKAFSVLPDAGLILVPFQYWDGEAEHLEIQLIDLSPDSLTARGVIEHKLSPRRATVHRERILSLSGRELLVVDAADRDQPVVRAEVELAWPVDRVLVAGPHLVEVAHGSAWSGDAATPTLRVATTDAPDAVLNALALPETWPVLGATVDAGRLYLAQGIEGGAVAPPEGTEDPGTPEPNLLLSIYDLNALPEFKLLGETKAVVAPLGWSADFDILWPRPNLLVLSRSGGGYWYPWLDIGVRPVDGLGVPGFWRGGYWGVGGRFLAFDVAEAAAPRFASDLDLSTNGWWSFSEAQTADGLVYLSHQVSVPAPPLIIADPLSGDAKTNLPPEGLWVQRSYLDVIDYADPQQPTIRKPVEVPGTLTGLSHDGAVVYTVGMRWKPDPTNWWAYDASEWLDAGAYDGVAVHLIDSVALSKDWPHPVAARGGVVWLARPEGGTSAAGLLESWRLSDDGKFVQLGKLALPTPAQRLEVMGDLVAAQLGQGVGLVDPRDPALPVSVGTGTPPGCTWLDLGKAVGSLEDGLWVPLGWNGVWHLPSEARP